ncbi:MAG TPA: hypothetical protein VGN20_20520 [Mucilaginibacter sp.]|jgi:hypothetical protein
MGTKIVGIVADNYKVEKFKAELTKHEFTNFVEFPFKGKTTAIKVTIDEKLFPKLSALILKVEAHFKRSN